MVRSKLALSAALLMLVAGAALGPAGSQPGEQGAWAERVQIVYDASTRSVERKRVRVWDGQPEKNLDFVWEPARDSTSTIAADGTVSGQGRLVWRVRGSASYDPKTIYSTYTGAIEAGRPQGKGRLELRSGEVFDGEWEAGRFEGHGYHIDAAGNRHEGRFADGLLDGEGRLLAATGEMFAGSFVQGRKHGRGTTRLAGGTTYESEWSMGQELGQTRPDALADATVGGLLKAQSGGGDAGKVEISTVVDERTNQEAMMQYQHLVRDEDVAIYPRDETINAAWNGTGRIDSNDYNYAGIDWTAAPVFVDVSLNTTDGSRVRMAGMELRVVSSDAYRKPMMSVRNHGGCIGFRPEFTLLNHGWGGVRDATMSVAFTVPGSDGSAPTSRSFSQNVPDFEDGTDVYVTDLLRQAGVDVSALATQRFSCPSYEEIEACKKKVFDTVSFGEIADYVVGDTVLYTAGVGTLNYSWADDAGNVYQQSEQIEFFVDLTAIEVESPLAEMGDGFGGSPEALRFQDVQLPIGQRDYVVNLAVRGSRNISEYTARLKISSEMTSFHQFQPVAKFADGSERRGKTVSLYYFRPRPSTFQSAVELPACYLASP